MSVRVLFTLYCSLRVHEKFRAYDGLDRTIACDVRFPIVDDRLDGAGRARSGTFRSTLFIPYKVVYGTLPTDGLLKYICTTRMPLPSVDGIVVGCVCPPWLLVEGLNFQEILSVAREHGISLSRAERKRTAAIDKLRLHKCALNCAETVTYFNVISSFGVPTPRPAYPFPPRPRTKEQIFNIVKEWCDDMSPSAVQEVACAVCACLTPTRDITVLSMTSVDLAHLRRPGICITRKERQSERDPLEELDGPVLYNDGMFERDGETFINLCRSCKSSVLRKRIGRHSLANGL